MRKATALMAEGRLQKEGAAVSLLVQRVSPLGGVGPVDHTPQAHAWW